MKYNSLFTFLCFLFTFSSSQLGLSQLQNLGYPEVVNYSKEESKSGTQNWQCERLRKGNILVANNDGLLIFDGNQWNSLKTPNHTVVRSMAISKDESKIWVGGQDELGYFEFQGSGFVYNDAMSKIPKNEQSLDDVWEIVLIDEDLYFRSRNKIFQILEDGTFKSYPSYSTITFIQKYNSSIYFNEWHDGLFTLIDGKKTFVPSSEILAQKAVVDIIEVDSVAIIITERNGLYVFDGKQVVAWTGEANKLLKQYKLISGHFIKAKNKIALGTEGAGLLIIDSNNSLEFHIDKKSGLQNNTISAISSDPFGNVWLGTYNGIDKVDLGVSYPVFYPDGELQGAVYDIEEWKNHYYFATNNGVYTIEKKSYYNPIKKEGFQLVKNTSGQAWGLDVIDGQLFIGHNNGSFLMINPYEASSLSSGTGVWKYVKYNEDHILLGTYGGLELFEKNDQSYKFVRRLPGFEESSRFLFKDRSQTIWVSHPYKGIFKIGIDESLKTIELDTITAEDGIPISKNCFVHQIDDLIFASDETTVYKYDYLEDRFIPDPTFNSIFEGQIFKRLIDSEKGLWYITNMEAGNFSRMNSGLDVKLQRSVLMSGNVPFVGGFENLHALSEEEVLLCTDKGVEYRSLANRLDFDSEVMINSLRIYDGQLDSIIYNRLSPSERDIELDFQHNDIRFDFVSNLLEGKERNILYSLKLEGFEQDWSEWNSTRFKEYTNLPYGEYNFKIRGKANGKEQGDITEFKFEIKAPWYASWPMRLLYVIFSLLFITLLILLPNRKIKKENEIILIEKQKTEEKVQDLEKEKLHNELKYQNKELANLTMHLLQKSETLNQIKSEVESVRSKVKDKQAKKEIKKIVSLLNSDNRLEEDWNNFSYHFDKVHQDFLKRIKEQYDMLSPTDLKLCAYLRLNLNTKEIAPLLNISTRGVEISRYRLRKKLNLTSDVNLNSFMISY